MKRFVVVGANGQVASEVAILLHGHPGLEVVPISRTRNGSAFLRSRGIPVFHGSITDAATARRALAGADIVANFALASGLGRAAVDVNHAIIDSTIEHSEPAARVVFFSTLAVHGNFDAAGVRSRSAYGDLKLRNERHFERSIARSGREGLILRLGHVCGDEQNISHMIRKEVEAGEVVLSDPDRASNTTHVVAIAEALLAIAEGRASTSGRYDCVNEPSWTWREVYEYEAANLDRTVVIRRGTSTPSVAAPITRRIFASAIRTVEKLGARATLDRALSLLPEAVVGRIKARHAMTVCRGEIASLGGSSLSRNPATWWPALAVENLTGPRNTRELIDGGVFRDRNDRAPWPRDLV